jgi:hypothetical protein
VFFQKLLIIEIVGIYPLSVSHSYIDRKSIAMSTKSPVDETLEHAGHADVESDAQKPFVDPNVAIHTDTYDIDAAALGNNLPDKYYLSPGFIGTVIVSQASCFAVAWVYAFTYRVVNQP